MDEISVLIGGKAGDGINNAGAMVAQLLNRMGYRIYLYFDYPSLIRGGHNFAIVRGSDQYIAGHRNRADFVLALNKETIDRHREKYSHETVIIFNADQMKLPGNGISVKAILSEEKAPEIMGNSAMIGAFAKAAGIEWSKVEEVFRVHMPKAPDLNLRVARKGYDVQVQIRAIGRGDNRPVALLTGNEAIGLGLVRGGLETYLSYPMTPSSSLLHFLAEQEDRFGLMVVHPENEIGVVIMALGFTYAGKRVAVGTSGGGFCLMTEGLSFAGMAELPVVFVVSQRTGPSTGLPTYTGQSELDFVRSAGQGEFPRFIVAPSDAQEALYWSAVAMNMAWKFQLPAFILPDKTLSEGTYSVDTSAVPEVPCETSPMWDGAGTYGRYTDTPSGVSPLAFPGRQGAVIKVDSYAHDESGNTTEEAEIVEMMAGKRLRKGEMLAREMEGYATVVVSGDPESGTALLCWGSTKGACDEVGARLGLRVVRPVVLTPFPADQLKRSLEGADHLIVVEENATAQLASLALLHGIAAEKKILRFDGRPFTQDDLLEKVQEAIA
ncbi:MAG: 2-oxoacid:ferredoxin oxidoreductase subunit alpha [Methanoregula sp. SKADARSKE-2]|nr:MAG: 2-oxoacid:ferredoxin oxidoreductase subunit alpha [Methanoregula sp. SKADARSKE-2]